MLPLGHCEEVVTNVHDIKTCSCTHNHISRPKFRVETNSTVVWLYVGGVSLILPDVRLGTVSLD